MIPVLVLNLVLGQTAVTNTTWNGYFARLEELPQIRVGIEGVGNAVLSTASQSRGQQLSQRAIERMLYGTQIQTQQWTTDYVNDIQIDDSWVRFGYQFAYNNGAAFMGSNIAAPLNALNTTNGANSAARNYGIAYLNMFFAADTWKNVKDMSASVTPINGKLSDILGSITVSNSSLATIANNTNATNSRLLSIDNKLATVNTTLTSANNNLVAIKGDTADILGTLGNTNSLLAGISSTLTDTNGLAYAQYFATLDMASALGNLSTGGSDPASARESTQLATKGLLSDWYGDWRTWRGDVGGRSWSQYAEDFHTYRSDFNAFAGEFHTYATATDTRSLTGSPEFGETDRTTTVSGNRNAIRSATPLNTLSVPEFSERAPDNLSFAIPSLDVGAGPVNLGTFTVNTNIVPNEVVTAISVVCIFSVTLGAMWMIWGEFRRS